MFVFSIIVLSKTYSERNKCTVKQYLLLLSNNIFRFYQTISFVAVKRYLKPIHYAYSNPGIDKSLMIFPISKWNKRMKFDKWIGIKR